VAKSTRTRRSNKAAKNKPGKPYSDFPLFDHDSGRWAKKIRGKLHYFGRWGRKEGSRIVWVEDVAASAQAAVDLYNEQRDDLQAGREPRTQSDALTVGELCAEFLESKEQHVTSGELKSRTFGEYHATLERVVAEFGRNRPVEDLRPEDFRKLRASLTKGVNGSQRGAMALAKDVRVTRMVFKFGLDNGLLQKPVVFGQDFKQPSRKSIRKTRQKNGPLMFEADELRALIDAASIPLKAMILLAANGGMGNTDVATLPLAAVELDGAVIDYPRPKTAVERRVPLWPETATALRKAIANRPAPADPENDGLCFLTVHGNPYTRTNEKDEPQDATWHDAVGFEFRKLVKKLKLNRPRLGFYALRHTFRTVADRSNDQPAVDRVMGHTRNDTASLYREKIDDDRLRAVVETVRNWLFAAEKEGSQAD
jgi:integrase